ncbi:MAG: hypothetical protein KF739_09880 [Cryobacterium sp.]|nr:hypothetical protein [Micrococcales bacterium]MBX3078481.1 hypothetical protein [Cryobacterium sp.]MBX3310725.1 hypothetical protein [Cryobacterium sp.]HNP16257.1 hypothetical protein [Terrimesophilobacter sp.]
MADFDPFANQGGPAAWDPEHRDDSKKRADELLKKLAESDAEPGSGPATYANEDAENSGDLDASENEPGSGSADEP